MNSNGRLFVLIGGTDEINGDYSRIKRRAADGRSERWSCPKTALPGDRVLLYIQDHKHVIASAVVKTRPKPGVNYPYEARLEKFRLLPREIHLNEFRRKFPRWAWLKKCRRLAEVPEGIADRLWGFCKRSPEKSPEPRLHIIPCGHSYAIQALEHARGTKRLRCWCPAKTRRGDKLLLYSARNEQAITCEGIAATDARRVRKRRYETFLSGVRPLPQAITLAELREMFPDWAWLDHVTAFCYVSDDKAKRLLARARVKTGISWEGERVRPTKKNHGGGFGSPEQNAIVEKRAVAFAKRHFARNGFSVTSVEADKLGYDLEVKRRGTALNVEVKGTSGSEASFIITSSERDQARENPRWRLAIVTNALTSPTLQILTGATFLRQYAFRILSFRATPKRRR